MAVRNLNLLRNILFSFALAVSFAGCAPMAGQETAGEYVDDATISTKVRAGLLNELGVTQIGVETMRNVVQLSGFVDSQQLKERAASIAHGVSGVKGVRNDIIVE